MFKKRGLKKAMPRLDVQNDIHEIDPIDYDFDTIAQVDNLTDKLKGCSGS